MNEKYYVRRMFNNPDTEITNTPELEKAKMCCDKYDNTKVFNQKGEILYTSKYGVIESEKNKNENIGRIISPSGAYLRSKAENGAKKIIDIPLRDIDVTLLKDKDINGFYHVSLKRRGIIYQGYILADSIMRY